MYLTVVYGMICQEVDLPKLAEELEALIAQTVWMASHWVACENGLVWWKGKTRGKRCQETGSQSDEAAFEQQALQHRSKTQRTDSCGRS